MFALLSSVVLVLLASSLHLAAATIAAPSPSFCLDELTTCKFSIHLPHTAQPPYTSESITGTFAYNPHKPVASPYAGYPKGFMLESLHGERVLYKGSEATKFRIVSLIPTLDKPRNETTLAGGDHFYVFDNIFIPDCSVPDHMDNDGWLYIVASEHCPQSKCEQPKLIPVNVFSANGIASKNHDLADLAGATVMPYGVNGSFVHLECNGYELCKPHKPSKPCP